MHLLILLLLLLLLCPHTILRGVGYMIWLILGAALVYALLAC
jgi:hypothetical protein